MSTKTETSAQLIRHATLLLDVGDVTFLVDAMFSDLGTNPTIPNTPNDRRNPLVPMPNIELSSDTVVVTHRHTDHFTEAANAALDADVLLFCQPAEAEAFVEEGFSDVCPVDGDISSGDATIRVSGSSIPKNRLETNSDGVLHLSPNSANR